MANEANFRMKWIKGMYIYTLLGAGGFGLLMLLVPGVVENFFGIPAADPMMYGVAASAWTGFGLLSILGLRSPLKFLPVLLMQCVYKTVWVLGVLLPLAWQGNLPAYAPLMIVVMVSYIIGDLIALPFGYLWQKT